jgi:hypothetical protein
VSKRLSELTPEKPKKKGIRFVEGDEDEDD